MALIRNKQAADAAKDAVVLDLGDLRRQAAVLRRRAREEAERIVAEAREEAARLTEGAEQRGLEEGFAKGHADGLEAGRKQGHDEALRQAKPELERLQDAWVRAAGTWDAERAEMVLDARRSLLELAVAMARRIVHRTLRLDPSVVADQVAAAVEHVARPCDVTIRVNPRDRPLVDRALPKLAESLGGAEHVTLTADPAVERGGCIVTHGKGRIDATLDTQLDRLADAILPDPDDQAPDPPPTTDPDL